MSNSIQELQNAPFIFVIGSNTTETHPVIALQIKKAVKNGATLIVVDPRKILLANFATRFYPIKIGSDIAFLNALAHILIYEDIYKKDYVRANTEGFEDLKNHLKNLTPEYAEPICGISAEEIRRLARMMASAPKVAFCWTLGITEHICGVANVQAISNLGLLLGSFGVESAGVNPLRGQNNVQGAGDMGTLPDILPGHQKVRDDELRKKFEVAYKTKLPSEPGKTKFSLIDEILKDKIKALYIMGENTALSDANALRTQRALDKVEFLVVQDIFLTETARYADVVLPACSFAETDGTFTNTDRTVQRVRKTIDPIGDSLPDWEIIQKLSNKMGYAMNYAHPSEIWDEARNLAPALKGITYARLDRGEMLSWPCPDETHLGTPYLHKDLAGGEVKGKFISVDYVPPAETPDEEFPIVLTTGRRLSAYHTGTQTRRAVGFDALNKEELLEINPLLAKKLKLSEGARCKVISRRGSVKVRVKITEKSPVDAVFMSFHHPETPTNILTSPYCDPVTETSEYKVCAVRIEKFSK